MPLQLDDDLPSAFPKPNYLTIESSKRGVITVIDKSRLPKDALEEADNCFLYEDGNVGNRFGVDWYGTESPNGQPIQGVDYFDDEGTIHLVMVAGGVIYRSLNNGTTWTQCTGYTMDTTADVLFNQYNGFLYLTNGVDYPTLYDGTTTLIRYTALTTPAAPSCSEGAGLGAGTAYTYTYKVARVNLLGFSIASPVNTGTIQTSIPRTSWDDSTTNVTLTTPVGEATQTRWDIYMSTDSTNYYYVASTLATEGVASTWVDNGSAPQIPSTLAPTASTAQGPKIAELSNVGSRMYGVRDPDNRYRIWFTSGTPPLGSFSGAYDGGYLDWQPGGKYFPVKAEDYRDGKGTPLATIWCDSADGQGCILQMSLETMTIGDVNITVPSAYKLPGSRGTPAPGSVVNVLNDYYFYNSQAIYNLGSRAQFMNLLSTDEATGNIRPTIKQISTDGEEGICSVYFDAKILFSVNYGATTNNYTACYDTERKAWLPTAFTIGFKRFLKYTDTNSNQKLLAYRQGDTKLSEIAASIQGDYGEPFNVSVYTGLLPVSKNRFEFQWTEEAELELSNPQGTINFELLGIERSRGFRTAKTASVQTTLISQGWDTFGWDSNSWDDTSVVPDTYSESSVKRYFTVQKELNAIQWHITTSSLDARFILRTLQTWGTETQSGKPRTWKL